MNRTQQLTKQIACRMLVLAATVGGHASAQAEDLEAGFRNPPATAGIRAYWWWLNGNVTTEAITRDLREMKAKGFSGALIFDADGSGQRGNRQVPAGPVFGSPKWTELFVHACREAERFDLELSLNIQSGWNLGGPNVTAEEATQTLVWSTTKIAGPVAMRQQLPAPRFRDCYKDVAVIAMPALSPGSIRPIQDLPLKSSTRELGMSAPDCRFLLETSPALAGELAVKHEDILNLSTHMNAQGMLHWDVPTGDWIVLRIGHTATGARVSTHSVGWNGRVLDYMNPHALDAYWKRNVAPLIEAIGPLAGTALRYIHTDSWEGGGMNWTPGFDRTFRDNRGYDPMPWLPVLAGYVVNNREDSNAFLADFRKTIGDRVADHYNQLASLARRHAMATHPECSGPHAGPLDGLKNYGRGELMMGEFWSPSPHRPHPPQRFFVKQAASAAHTYGKRLVAAEGFTTIGPHWNDVPWSELKPSFDHELCGGLNLLFVHTFTCSPQELGLPGQEYFAGTHFNPQLTWWGEASAVIDYFRRCQYLAQQGRFVADVIHYYGDHIPNIAGHKGSDPAGTQPGFDYDTIGEELLLDGLVTKNGRLVLPSGMEYRVLVLPDHRVLSLGALRKVAELVRAGATVAGPKPLRAVSLTDGAAGKAAFNELTERLWGPSPQTDDKSGIRQVGAGRVAWGMSARDLLQADGVAPDVSLADDDRATVLDVDWIHYKIGAADVYFLAELSGKAQRVEATFRVDGRIPEIWNAVDGSIHEAASYNMVHGRTRVPIRLDAYDSVFVVFRTRTDKRERNADSNFPSWRPTQTIDGPWRVGFDAKWGGPEEPIRLRSLTDWTDHDDPRVKHFSGKAVYRTTFRLDQLPVGVPLAIELGRVADIGIARVRLNGIDLGVVWRPPFLREISQSAKQGENVLEIEVVNSWRNRLIRDRALPQAERLTWTNIAVTDSWRPQPSGLLGPVRIVAKVAEH